MNKCISVVGRLTLIKMHLSDKRYWEENWDFKQKYGYFDSLLSHQLSVLIINDDDKVKRQYPIAYQCVARAIIELCDKDITKPSYNYRHMVPKEYQPTQKEYAAVDNFKHLKDHALLMKVMDLAIRYARLYIYG